MTADEPVEPLSPYRGVRPLKEANVFAKYRGKKKPMKKEEEQEPPKKKPSDSRVDIEA